MVLFFFACTKKNQKSAPENDYIAFSGEEVGLSFCAAVASALDCYCACYFASHYCFDQEHLMGVKQRLE